MYIGIDRKVKNLFTNTVIKEYRIEILRKITIRIMNNYVPINEILVWKTVNSWVGRHTYEQQNQRVLGGFFMRCKISILYMILTCTLLTAGCNLPQKNMPQKESGDTDPSRMGNKQSAIEPRKEPTKNNFPVNAEKNKEKYDKKIAYITIDDGPSANNTVAILDILKKSKIKATFFVLPKNHMDDIYARIINEGHVIGNHSYSHVNHLYTSANYFEKDILKAKAFIYKKLNYTTTVFRFPGGTPGRKKSIIQKRVDILNKNGYRYFDWDVSVADTDPNLKKYRDEKFIVNLMAGNVINNTNGKKRIIVLMHDDSTKIYTVKALPCIIDGLKKQGYIFDVLTDYKK